MDTPSLIFPVTNFLLIISFISSSSPASPARVEVEEVENDDGFISKGLCECREEESCGVRLLKRETGENGFVLDKGRCVRDNINREKEYISKRWSRY